MVCGSVAGVGVAVDAVAANGAKRDVIKQPLDEDLERIDAAFNRALSAEASAREAVEQCRQQADRLVSDADAHARRLVDRTDERIRAVQLIADRRLQNGLDDLLGTVPQTPDTAFDPASELRLDAAITALADEMIGAGTPVATPDRPEATVP